MAIDTLVLDLDGTLLYPDRTPSRPALRLLERLYRNGMRIIPATARPPRAVSGLLPDFMLSGFVIYYNGALVRRGGDDVFSLPIAALDLAALIVLVRDNMPGVSYGFEWNDHLYTCGLFDRHMDSSYYTETELSCFEPRPTPKFLVDLSNGADPAVLKDGMPGTCRLLITDNGSLAQISHINADKKNALDWILSVNGGSLENVSAFGDDHNDIGLLSGCGISYAMDGAPPEVIKAARNTARSGAEDGVYFALLSLFPWLKEADERILHG